MYLQNKIFSNQILCISVFRLFCTFPIKMFKKLLIYYTSTFAFYFSLFPNSTVIIFLTKTNKNVFILSETNYSRYSCYESV